jgi:hypothetical protein
MFIREKVLITNKFQIDKEIHEHIELYTKESKLKEDLPAVYSLVNLEGRFTRVRSEETNLGNLTADLIRTEY